MQSIKVRIYFQTKEQSEYKGNYSILYVQNKITKALTNNTTKTGSETRHYDNKTFQV